jgi:hypothetical protein
MKSPVHYSLRVQGVSTPANASLAPRTFEHFYNFIDFIPLSVLGVIEANATNCEFTRMRTHTHT